LAATGARRYLDNNMYLFFQPIDVDTEADTRLAVQHVASTQAPPQAS